MSTRLLPTAVDPLMALLRSPRTDHLERVESDSPNHAMAYLHEAKVGSALSHVRSTLACLRP